MNATDIVKLLAIICGVTAVMAASLTAAAGDGATQACENARTRLFPTITISVAALAQDPSTQDEEEGDAPTRDRGSFIERRKKSRAERIEKTFASTGKDVACLPGTRNVDSTILSDQAIFFESFNRGYMSKLTKGCSQLLTQDRFQMNVFGGRICSGQIITVLDNFGRNFGSCTLGDFEVYKRRDGDS